MRDGDLYVDCLNCNEPTRYGFSYDASVKAGFMDQNVTRGEWKSGNWVEWNEIKRIPVMRQGKVCHDCAANASHTDPHVMAIKLPRSIVTLEKEGTPKWKRLNTWVTQSRHLTRK